MSRIFFAPESCVNFFEVRPHFLLLANPLIMLVLGQFFKNGAISSIFITNNYFLTVNLTKAEFKFILCQE